MRSARTKLIAVAVAVGLAGTALGQQTLDNPRGQFEPYEFKSGAHENLNEKFAVVAHHAVHVPDAAWLRVYFGDVNLSERSYLRITSVQDGEEQMLDAGDLKMWDNTSAYFNGDTVIVELIAAPSSNDNSFEISRVALELEPAQEGGFCGMCGADNRVPSNEEWSARLLPAGCTASVYNTDSCMVSAGHCIGGNMVVQFRVPDSTSTCVLRHPPVVEQFPVPSNQFQDNGPGFDWAVMTTGTNNQNEKPYDRYGELRPIAASPPGVGQPVAVWGYGVDDQCTRTQTQQTHSGGIVQVSGNWVTFTVDITFGNSGSALIRTSDNAIVGIVTHCPCPNLATRIDKSDFAAARDNLCPPGGPVCASSGSLLEGTGEVNDFSATCGSDNTRWGAHGTSFAYQIADPVVQYELVAAAPTNFGGGTITIDIEASKQNDDGNLNLRAHLFNFNTFQFVTLPGVMPLATNDAVQNFGLPGGSDPADFIDSGDNVLLLLQTIQTSGSANVRTRLDEVLFNFDE